MSFLVFWSLIIKAIGSVLEILAQSLISQNISVEAYGSYSFFVTIAEGIYSLFFCGIIKFNNYYIPQGQDVTKFRKKLYLRYALPILIIFIVISIFISNAALLMAAIAGFLYFCAMDRSSRMMSIGRYGKALVGEYCLGRFIVVFGILLLIPLGITDIRLLYVVYALQFVAAIIYYRIVNKRMDKFSHPLEFSSTLEKGAIKKYCTFQSTEIAHTITMQTSVIVQYLFVGAYETAIVSIVLVVRKLINFITGPTSKLYQPEFTKRYHENDMKGLSKVYAQITRTQLCFMTPVFTMLIARPDILLKIYNSELVEYGFLIRYTAIVFLFMVVFGPLANFLCMTGHEKSDTLSNWISVFIMYGVMFLARGDRFFVVYGFCSQIIFSNLYKFVVFLKYMKRPPMPLPDYVKLLAVNIIAIAVMFILPVNILICIIVFVAQLLADFLWVFPKEERKELMSKTVGKMRK